MSSVLGVGGCLGQDLLQSGGFCCCPYRLLGWLIDSLFHVALDAVDRGLVKAGGLLSHGGEDPAGGHGEPQRASEGPLLGGGFAKCEPRNAGWPLEGRRLTGSLKCPLAKHLSCHLSRG